MKKNFQFLFIFAAMILCCGNVWSAGNYYAKLKAVVVTDGVANSNAGGKVYVATEETEPTSTDWKTSEFTQTGTYSWYSNDPKSAPIQLFAYARNDRGYEFLGWSDNENGSSFFSTSPSTNVTQTTTASNANNAPVKSIYANFKSISSFSVRYYVPVDGTYTIDYSGLETDPLLPATGYVEESTYIDDQITLNALPDDGFFFGGWCKNESTVPFSYDNPLTFTLSEQTSIRANFIFPYNVTFLGSDYATISVQREEETIGIGETQEGVTTGTNFSLSFSNLSEDYEFFGWVMQSQDGKEYYLSRSNTYNGSVSIPNVNVYADIKKKTNGTPIFINGTKRYESLKKACEESSVGDVIIVSRGGTVTESAIVPEGVTLLVPFDDAYTCYTEKPQAWHGHSDRHGNYGKEISGHVGSINEDYSKVHVILRLGDNVALTVNGVLSISAERWVTHDSGSSGSTYPHLSGDYRIDHEYGLIDMSAESTIIVGEKGKLYCWGRIRGDGSIIANNGAEVRESFVFTDHRESDAYGCIASYTKCFPMNQYYVQDIQVPITFKYGAKEILVSGMFIVATKPVYDGTMSFVGKSGDSNPSLIEIADGGSVTKKYNVAKDRLEFTFRNTSFNNSYLALEGLGSSSSTATHIFTITNNWTINVESGTTNIEHDIVLSAGAEMKISKDANVVVKSGASLYLFDKLDWTNHACSLKIVPLYLPKYELEHYDYNSNDLHSGKWGNPSHKEYLAIRVPSELSSASIDVNGTLTIEGGENSIYASNDYEGPLVNDSHDRKSGLYTTLHNANIFSSKGGGQIIYEKGAGTQQFVPQLWGTGRGSTYNFILGKYACTNAQTTNVAINPAKLMNADSTYVSTADFTTATQFTYKNSNWIAEEIIANTITINSDNVKMDENEPTHIDDATYTVENAQMVEAETVIINNGSTLNVETGGAVVANTLALNTTPSYSDDDNNMGLSSQITGDGSLTATNVYIDIKMDPSGTMNSSRYYAFAVPFNVKVSGGIEKLDGKGHPSVAVTGKDYYAYTYSGDNRAANGKNGSAWVVVESGDTIKPGVFYLIEFANNNYNVFRFHKVAEDKLNNAGEIQLEAYGDGDTENPNNGWNGIANNALENIKLSIEGTDNMVAQVLEPDGSKFTTIDLNKVSFAVGTPMFIQVAAKAYASNITNSSSAPERRFAAPVKNNTYGNYAVRIAAEGTSKMADQLFVSASEDAAPNYVIGKDLVKMFMGDATVAQLWVNNYGKKLSMNQSVLNENAATMSLTLYAPKAGKYQVYLRDIPEDATLYLLENGNAIANLNEGTYVVSLNKGENTQYGLRINTIKTIPGVITSIDEALVGNKVMNKILLNGNVYIVRNGLLFNPLGQQH